jgi:heat shock protein HslJ
MGQEAADQLTRNLSAVDEKFFDQTNFNPVQGISCHTLEKSCYQEDTLHPALSAALFGDNAEEYGPEVLTGTNWAWGESRYNNNTEVRPPESSSFRITFKPEGSLLIQADCNTIHGSYRASGKSILITLGPSTMAACAPDSPDQQFLRDLEGAAVWFLKKGDLYLDLKADAGTMDFYTSTE